MRKLTKLFASIGMGFAFALSFAFGVATIPQASAAAPEGEMIENVQIENGASIRVNVEGGVDSAIRFKTYVKKSYYDGLYDPAVGVCMIPRDLLNGELTNQTKNVKNIVSQVWAEETDEYYVFNSVLWGIPADSYGRPIVARAYIKMGSTYEWTGAITRSLAYVASEAIVDGVNEAGVAYTAEQLNTLKGYIDGSITAFSISEESVSLELGETASVTTEITAKYDSDYENNLNMLAPKFTSANENVAAVEDGKIIAKGAGVTTVTATMGGSYSDTFTVTVQGEQKLVASSQETLNLGVSVPVGATVNVLCGGASIGTDVSSVATSALADGQNNVQVQISENGNTYTIDVPVTKATAVIRTLEDWKTYVQPSATTAAVTGYYVLGNDIDASQTIVSSYKPTIDTSGTYGFKGTLDGNEYEFKYKSGANGIFGVIGTGAVIKNVTLTDMACAPRYADGSAAVSIARAVVGAKFQDATINLNNCVKTTIETYGAMAYECFKNCEFENVDINVDGTVFSLFGGGGTTAGAWTGLTSTFTNCTINLMPGAKIGEIGHTGNVVYTAEGLAKVYAYDMTTEVSGATPLTGVTVNTVKEVTVTLEDQYWDMTQDEHSIDLGKYADYKISSIKLDGATDLGTDPANIVYSQADNTKHGAHTLTVKAVGETEVATITVPVMMVTAYISTIAELNETLTFGSGDANIYGYYVLTNDLDGRESTGFVPSKAGAVSWASGNAMRATLDGRGYKIYINSSKWTNGIFGTTNQATIKNLNVVDEYKAENKSILAYNCYNTVLENVNVTISGGGGSKAANGSAPIIGYACDTVTMTNVTILTNVTQAVVFGNTVKSSYNNVVILGDFAAFSVASATAPSGVTMSNLNPRAVTLDNRQNVYLEVKRPQIDLGEYSDYTVTAIKLGDYDLGTDAGYLILDDTFKADTASHGLQNVIVSAYKGSDLVEITVPVTMITQVITTADEFMDIMPKTASAAVYGYYVLGDNIGSEDYVVSANGRNIGRTPSSENVGFRGTIDGDGFAFTFSIAGATVDSGTNDQYGLFGFMGTGATVKNITFNCEAVRAATGTHLFAQTIQGASFANVTINLEKIYARFANAGVFAASITNSKFTDVEIIAKSKELNAAILFANPVNDWDGTAAFSGNTFTNTTVYTYPNVSFAALATNGTETIAAVDGVTVVPVEEQAVALAERQDIVVSENMNILNLGEYSDYDILSITCGDYDLGDSAVLTLPAELVETKADHGEKNLIVKASKGAELLSITVPVTIVTAYIADLDDWALIQPKANNETVATYGYYKMTADILAAGTTVNSYKPSITTGGTYGFCGTLDGDGHVFEYISGANGIFGAIGSGAVIKNVTLTDMACVPAYIGGDYGSNKTSLARAAIGASFENVTINLYGAQKEYRDGMGAMTTEGFVSCVFTDVEINVIGEIYSLFGSANSQYWGLKAPDFTNTVVNLIAGSKIGQIGRYMDTVYTADGLEKVYAFDMETEVEGAEILGGITVNNVTAREATLDFRQEIDLSKATVALALVGYRDYKILAINHTITEIVTSDDGNGGTTEKVNVLADFDLGSDLANLDVSELIKAENRQYHGNQTVTVTAIKDGDLVNISVPVTFITKYLSTISDWQTYIQQETTSTVKFGYFVLANDIAFSGNSYGNPVTMNKNLNNAITFGFRGSIDGAGYEVSHSGSWYTNGIFGAIGSGAKLKNITFTQSSNIYSYDANRNFFGAIVTNATFENVTINLKNQALYNSYNGNVNWPLTYYGFPNCYFNDVTFNIENSTITSLLCGKDTNQYLGLRFTRFNDCTINVLDGSSSIGELGHTGTTVYQPLGVELADGQTEMQGITLLDQGNYLLRAGASPYTIVKPASSSIDINKAAEELQRFFEEATGVTLPIITDAGLTAHDANTTYISLGNTKIKNSGVTNSLLEIKKDAYAIQTVDLNVYIYANSDQAVIYGVYDLLGQLFGFDTYYMDCYSFKTTPKTIELEAYETVGQPAIDARSIGGVVYSEADNYIFSDRLQISDGYWHRLLPIVNEYNGETNNVHNSLYYFPTETYKSTYKSRIYSDQSTWTSNSYSSGVQLCYTARGVEADYNFMVQHAADRIINSLQTYTPSAYPNYNAVLVGIEDNYYMCSCSACDAVVSEYGAISATVIIFLNDVAAIVDDWMASNSTYARDLQYMFLAYQQCLILPSSLPEISAKIAPFVAMSEMDHSKSVDDETSFTNSNLGMSLSNATVMSYVIEWGNWAVENGAKAWAWTYGNFFRDYFIFYDCYEFYESFFISLDENCTGAYEFIYINQHSQHNASGNETAFYGLNSYVLSKLAWNPYADVNTLIADYMSAMYLDAADEMTAVFNYWKSLFSSKLSTYARALGTQNPADVLTKADVDQMFTLFDAAYAAIEKYQTIDAQLYAKLKKHIDMEYLSPLKIALVELQTSYGVTKTSKWFGLQTVVTTTADYEAKKALFIQLCNELGITRGGELDAFATIDGVVSQMATATN